MYTELAFVWEMRRECGKEKEGAERRRELQPPEHGANRRPTVLFSAPLRAPSP